MAGAAMARTENGSRRCIGAHESWAAAVAAADAALDMGDALSKPARGSAGMGASVSRNAVDEKMLGSPRCGCTSDHAGGAGRALRKSATAAAAELALGADDAAAE